MTEKTQEMLRELMQQNAELSARVQALENRVMNVAPVAEPAPVSEETSRLIVLGVPRTDPTLGRIVFKPLIVTNDSAEVVEGPLPGSEVSTPHRRVVFGGRKNDLTDAPEMLRRLLEVKAHIFEVRERDGASLGQHRINSTEELEAAIERAGQKEGAAA